MVLRALFALLLGTIVAHAEEAIRFAPKMFHDSAEYVEISGTLTGNDISYPNNTHVISCEKKREECFVVAVEADKNYVTRVTGPAAYPIKRWTDVEIIAAEGDTVFGCSRTTISIARKQSKVLWVQEPVNQTQQQCAKSETKVLKWTIEDPAYWRAINGK